MLEQHVRFGTRNSFREVSPTVSLLAMNISRRPDTCRRVIYRWVGCQIPSCFDLFKVGWALENIEKMFPSATGVWVRIVDLTHTVLAPHTHSLSDCCVEMNLSSIP